MLKRKWYWDGRSHLVHDRTLRSAGYNLSIRMVLTVDQFTSTIHATAWSMPHRLEAQTMWTQSQGSVGNIVTTLHQHLLYSRSLTAFQSGLGRKTIAFLQNWHLHTHLHFILVVCPTNRSSNERKRPQLHDTVYFERCYCPAIKDFGVIMLIEGLWVGWVQAHHVSRMQTLLDSKETVTSGRITHVEEFFWRAGGGICNKGTVQLH